MFVVIHDAEIQDTHDNGYMYGQLGMNIVSHCGYLYTDAHAHVHPRAHSHTHTHMQGFKGLVTILLTMLIKTLFHPFYHIVITLELKL